LPLTIREDDLRGPEIRALLEAHLDTMRSLSPPESIHALDLSGLRRPEVTFWTVWRDGTLVGCGALKQLSPTVGEIKSMHTAAAQRGQGIAEAALLHILETARTRGLRRLFLETGSQPGFEPARKLYAKHGFAACGPFGDYREDPNSVFMTLELQPEASVP
jgi:putative acetyltransferase